LHIETYKGKNGTGHKLVGRIIGFDFVSSRQESRPTQENKPNQARSGSGLDDIENDISFLF